MTTTSVTITIDETNDAGKFSNSFTLNAEQLHSGDVYITATPKYKLFADLLATDVTSGVFSGPNALFMRLVASYPKPTGDVEKAKLELVAAQEKYDDAVKAAAGQKPDAVVVAEVVVP